MASVVANLANLGLDWVLIFALEWGVAGAAMATSIAQCLSFAILATLAQRKEMVALQDLWPPPKPSELGPLIKARICTFYICIVVLWLAFLIIYRVYYMEVLQSNLGVCGA